MRLCTTGAENTRPSRMMANWRPMFCSVAVPNLRAPSEFNEKPTAGRLFSSSVGRALRRSRPVTTEARRTA
jgi:hypothetical protein